MGERGEVQVAERASHGLRERRGPAWQRGAGVACWALAWACGCRRWGGYRPGVIGLMSQPEPGTAEPTGSAAARPWRLGSPAGPGPPLAAPSGGASVKPATPGGPSQFPLPPAHASPFSRSPMTRQPGYGELPWRLTDQVGVASS